MFLLFNVVQGCFVAFFAGQEACVGLFEGCILVMANLGTECWKVIIKVARRVCAPQEPPLDFNFSSNSCMLLVNTRHATIAGYLISGRECTTVDGQCGR